MSRTRGFTLIELLVVIAIIGILAALLFPVFLTAKKRAQYSACASNTQQWLKAMQMYMVDSNDVFPVCGASLAFPHKGKPPFYELMWKYTSKNDGIKWCSAMIIAYCGGSYETARKSFGWSYWFQCRWSWRGFDDINPKASLCGIRLSEVKYPSRSPAVGDVNRCHEASLNSNSGVQAYLYPIGYVDGHVRDVVMVAGDESKYWYVGVDGSPPKK